MQLHPELTDFFTPPVNGPLDPFDFSVAHLLGLTSSNLVGRAVFDRTASPTAASPFGQNTDSWQWFADPWPEQGFALRIGSNPPFQAASGPYTTWPNLPFSPSNTPPQGLRYRIVSVQDPTTVLGELRVEEEAGGWRQTWWASGHVLQHDRIPFLANVDYRFERLDGESTLDLGDLFIVEHNGVATERDINL